MDEVIGNLVLFCGGKFRGVDEYDGGVMDVVEDVYLNCISYESFIHCVSKDIFEGPLRIAFRVKSTQKLVFCEDEKSFKDNMFDCFDMENMAVTIYVEYVGREDGALVENEVKLGEIQSRRDANNVGNEEHKEFANMDMSSDDEEWINYPTEVTSDEDDGMVDADFSSKDEEFFICRKKRIEMKKMKKAITNDNESGVKEIREHPKLAIDVLKPNDDGYESVYASSDESAASLDEDDTEQPFRKKRQITAV